MKSKHIIILLAAFTLLFACQAEEKTIPNELLGVWGTSDSEYEDCFFEIGKDSIIFINTDPSELSFDTNIISKIEMTLQEGKTLYEIYYNKVGEEEYQFSFYYYPQDGSIRFKNQMNFAWRKTDDQGMEELFKESG